MGIEAGTAALIGAGISGGAALIGAKGQRHAAHQAERAANDQREHQARQDALYAKEAQRLKKQQDVLQQKINAGIARGNRRRIKGGLFGEGEPTPSAVSPTLG